MLALIRGVDIQGEGCEGLVRDVTSAISGCTRETDAIGWYETDRILGVLLTEVGGVEASKVEILHSRISSAVRQAIRRESFCQLGITIHVFPSPTGAGESGWKEIYRDLHRQEDGRQKEHVLKRVIDISGSLLALLTLLPVFAVIAVLIKSTSKGSILFCQQRVGQFGSLFNFYKFRSMYQDNDSTVHREYVAKLIDGAEQAGQANGSYKLTNDPRVTPLGRFLRKTSLDELPQFVNVLLGDMSLVGPRPPLPYEFERYRPWHRRRVAEIKPGLTGLWQIEGRSRTTFDQMVRMDIRYSQKRSLWLDLKIILQTPAAMFSGKGAF